MNKKTRGYIEKQVKNIVNKDIKELSSKKELKKITNRVISNVNRNSKRSLTIKTIYPDEHDMGLKLSFVTTKIVKAFYIPRVSLNSFRLFFHNYMHLNGVYILFDRDKTKSYIGKTTDVWNRTYSHLNKKDKESWWRTALIFVIDSNYQPFGPTSINELESLMYNIANNNIYMNSKDSNAQNPKKQVKSNPSLDDAYRILKNINILSQSFNLDIFKNFDKVDIKYKFISRSPKCNAKAILNPDDSMTILKGSKICPSNTSNNSRRNIIRTRITLKNNHMVKNNKFIRNCRVSSPTEAADIVFSSHQSGTHFWINKRSNKELGDIFHQYGLSSL